MPWTRPSVLGGSNSDPHGKGAVDACAAHRGRGHFKAATQGVDPICHVGEARATFYRVAIEPPAVVSHLEEEPALRALKLHYRALSGGILLDVLQRLETAEVDGCLHL